MKKVVSLLLILAFAVQPQVVLGASAEERIDAIEQRLPTLKALLTQCEEMGLSTDYERVNVTVIDKFIDYGREDISNNLTDRAVYVADCLETLYDRTKEKLDAYIAGTDFPLALNRYYTSDSRPEIRGSTVYGQTKNNQTGKVTEQPIIFTGYGHFTAVANDVPLLKDMGVSLIQNEIGPSAVIVDPTLNFAGGYRALINGSTVKVTADLDEGRNGTALHLTKTSEPVAGEFYQLTQYIPVKPGTRYDITFYSKGVGYSLFPSGWGSSAQSVHPTQTSDFVKYTTSYTTGANQITMELMMICSALGEFWMDDLTVIDTTTGENVVLNGDFETPLIVQDGFGIDPLASKSIENLLARAEEHDIGVTLLISPHYFPPFIIQEDAENISHSTAYGIEHTGYNIHHTRVQQVLNAFVDELIPKVKDYKSLHSICLTNEPTYDTLNDGDRYLPQYQAYLAQKYGTIDALNAAYQADYADFSQIGMPEHLAKTAEFYDWTLFNNETFAAWHKTLADRIGLLAPDVPLHSKMLEYLPFTGERDSNYFRNFLLIGSDAREFSKFSDYAGNDAHAYFDEGLSAKMLWYDYLATITGKPAINTEDHILEAGDQNYIPEQAAHIGSDLWQGAIHGRVGQVSWVYERTMGNPEFETSLLTRPDVMATVGKYSLDLSRLSNEVTALANIPATVAVMYSHETRVYNENHYSALLQSYKAVSQLGRRVAVLDDKKITEDGLNGIELLILPDVTNITKEALGKIASYKNNGGKVVILNRYLDDIFAKYDQYNQPHSASDIEAVKSGSVMVDSCTYSNRRITSPSVEELYDVMKDLVTNEVTVIDNATNQKVSGVEWRYAEENGQRLMNLYHNEAADKTVRIASEDTAPLMVTDLISNQRLNPDCIVLKANQPVLLTLRTEPLPPVSDLKVSGQPKGYTISWTPPQNRQYKGAVIYYKLSDGGLRYLATTDQDTSSYLADLPGEEYTIVVKAMYAGSELSEGKEKQIMPETVATISQADDKIVVSGNTAANRQVNMLLVKKPTAEGDASGILAMNDGLSDPNGSFTFSFGIDLMRMDSSAQELTLYLRASGAEEPTVINITSSGIIFEQYAIENFSFAAKTLSGSTIKILGDVKKLPAGKDMSCSALIAIYKDDVLQQVAIKPIQLNSSDEGSIDLEMDVPTNLGDGKYRAKAFIFNEDLIQPLTGSIEIHEEGDAL